MSLKAFFKEAAIQPQNIRIAISDRFNDDDGKPELWELRAISEEENSGIKDSCTSKSLIKGGRQGSVFDGPLYTKRMTAASVVYPDLSNAELQGTYKVVGEVALLNAMLLPGEMTTLQQEVQQINGFDAERLAQGVAEVKNS